MVLYAATTNTGKIADFSGAGEGGEVELWLLPNMRDITPPAEEMPTFEENARLKASYYSLHAPGLLVLADDSGLEVESLHGLPGVRSARFADDRSFWVDTALPLDVRNNLCLLEALSDVPDKKRQARYRCVLAVASDGKVLLTAEGSVEGVILKEPRGENGFGYDPMFYLPQYDKTMAEMDVSEKWEYSHRGMAFRNLLEKLEI